VCVAVDGAVTTGPADGRLQGFLHGITPATSQAMVSSLAPKSWRINSWATYALVKPTLGSRVTFVLSDGWRNQYGPLMPWAAWPLYEDYVRSTVRTSIDQGTPVDYWDIANEPNSGWLGTRDQIHEMFLRAHDAIRSVDPAARIVATSQSTFQAAPSSDTVTALHDSDLSTFLDYAEQHRMQIDALSWHEIGTLPEDVLAHAATVRSLLGGHPNLLVPNPELHINEFSGPDDYRIPGWTVGWLATMQEAGIAVANRSCWDRAPESAGDSGPYSECSEGLDGLLRADGATPQPLYWVHRAYAALTGSMAAVTSTDVDTSALASVDASATTLTVIVGRHRQRAHDGRVASDVQLDIAYPFAGQAVTVSVERIPDLDTPGPLTAAQPVSSGTAAISNGVVHVDLPGFRDGDAYVVRVTS
jgi:hypothetical protein